MVTETSSTAISASAAGAIPPEQLLVRHIQAHVHKGHVAADKAQQHFIAAGQYLIVLKTNYAPTWQAWEAILKTKIKISTGRASELMQLADGRKNLQQIRDGKAQSVAKLRAKSSSLVVKREEDTNSLHHSSEEKGQPATTTQVIPLAQSPQQIPEDDDFIERAKQEDARGTAVADEMIAENPGLVTRLLNAIDGDFPEDLDFLFVLRRRQKETIAPPTKAENARADVRHLTDDDWTQINAHQLIDDLTASSSNEREAAANLLVSGSRRYQFDAATAAVADLYQQLAKAGK
jgi:hypothetical protein